MTAALFFKKIGNMPCCSGFEVAILAILKGANICTIEIFRLGLLTIQNRI